MSGFSISFDGIKIFFKTIGHGDNAIVFVHGWCCDHSYWQNQIEYFCNSFRVVVPDLAGHGNSGKDRYDWTMQAYGRDVQSVIEKLDLQNVILVGHSMGGPVVVEAAKLLKDRVKLVVPIDYFNNVESRMSEQDLQNYLQEMSQDFKNWTKANVKRWLHAQADPLLVRSISENMANGYERMAISSMKHIRQYQDDVEISKLKVPMHLINSDQWPTDLEKARKHKPDIKVSIIKDTGHFVMLESPTAFNSALSKLLNQLK
jgi:pimeloyl-ACP methyl ester carboxylesterase